MPTLVRLLDVGQLASKKLAWKGIIAVHETLSKTQINTGITTISAGIKEEDERLVAKYVVRGSGSSVNDLLVVSSNEKSPS